MKAMRSTGVLAVSLAAACSSSLRSAYPTQQVRSDGAAESAIILVQGDLKTGGTLAPSQTVEGDRSPAAVDRVMRKRGYTLAIYRGERVYCRTEALTGSNLESKICLTAMQIEDQERGWKGHPPWAPPSRMRTEYEYEDGGELQLREAAPQHARETQRVVPCSC